MYGLFLVNVCIAEAKLRFNFYCCHLIHTYVTVTVTAELCCHLKLLSHIVPLCLNVVFPSYTDVLGVAEIR